MTRFPYRRSRRAWGLVLLAAAAVAAAVFSRPADAAEARIAVAANFTGAAKEIGALFAEATDHEAVFSFGSTGQLYTQIAREAPFEVFLAADRERPRMAVEEGLAVPDSLFTYATGKLVLFSKDECLVHGAATLRQGNFSRIAIANPVTAPYGAATVEAMKALGVYEALSPKLVQGNTIAQTYQFVQTGNAEIGFVALSQVAHHDDGSRWVVPEGLYPAVAQDAVLLKRGADNKAARAFIAFLGGPEARAVKEKYGYGPGD